jgi:hypothetical protein
MKRTLGVLLAVAVLVTVLAPAALAREVELSEIERPVDASATQYPQSSAGRLPGSQAVTEEQSDGQMWVEPYRHEDL